MCDMTAVSWIFGVALVALVAGLPAVGVEVGLSGSGGRGHSLAPTGMETKL